ncbi:MAG: hypothetical protein R2795_14265 [Saprospiraceae bacterium]
MGDDEWASYFSHFSPLPGARQIFDVSIEAVQTSCGYAVPLYEFQSQRSRLLTNMENKTPAELSAYWKEHNTNSIDGKPTGITLM